MNDLLPPNRKLIPLKLVIFFLNLWKNFFKRPLEEYSINVLNKDRKVQTRFLLWKFEDELKQTYEKFVHSLEVIFYLSDFFV